MSIPATTARPQRAFDWVDLGVLVALGAGIYAVVMVAREWTGVLQPVAEVHLEARYLPVYTVFSLTRGVLAYLVSFLFTMVYGWVAARVAGADRVMLPVLDILQSIPVLGFLPGFVIGMVHLFPHRNLGLEMAAVLMIFTGQAWNMTFAFYSSLKSVPEDLVAVTRLAKLTWWQRFLRLDLSFAASSLVWNSMMSMAGGWFFLTVSEAFVLGRHDFRLPGLGSYMSLAIERGNVPAQVFGVLAMIAMIVLLDQFVWRPVVAWSQRFTTEEGESQNVLDSWLWNRLRRSRCWLLLTRLLATMGDRRSPKAAPRPAPLEVSPPRKHRIHTGWKRVLIVVLAMGLLYGLVKYIGLLRALSGGDWLRIFASTGMTFLRVVVAVALASLWTVPVGVIIGRNPRWARALQPVIQTVASFPAPMIFPVAVGLVLSMGGGLGVGSILLLVLGTQWYILFNVIAGSSTIPRDLWEVAELGRFSRRDRWVKLILPSIFPSLLTGWITAMGGAWNASIVAEYMKYQGKILSTVGLGALISQATDQGNFHLLAAAVGIMSLVVVGFNRLVWRPLSHQAQTRFSLTA